MLTRSAWLLGPDRADWLEGLVAESTESGVGRPRVAWLLGGVWLIVSEALRRGATRMLTFIAAAGVVLWIVWPGSSSDSAVPVNRVEIPIYLGLLALLPLLIRRYYGPVRSGRLPRAVRVAGYVAVLALITGQAVQSREGQKLGAYFHDGGRVTGLIALLVAGYTAVLLILTSRRARLSRPTLPITVGTGTLAGVLLFARFCVHLHGVPLGWWLFVWLGLPVLIGFAVTRFAARDLSGSVMIPARQGGLAAICASGTVALVLLTLTTITVAVAPQRVPLQQPPPPPHGGGV